MASDPLSPSRVETEIAGADADADAEAEAAIAAAVAAAGASPEHDPQLEDTASRDAEAVAAPAKDDGAAPQPDTIDHPSATPPPSTRSSPEPGETHSASPAPSASDPPLPAEQPPLPSEAPPLPDEAPPAAGDDGWDFQWDATTQAYFFYNRFTGATQWDNPRLAAAGSSSATTAPGAPGTTAAAAALTAPPPLPADTSRPPAGGYNPAIHGDYDPTAWYAQTEPSDEEQHAAAAQAGQLLGGDYAAAAAFIRFTSQFQAVGDGPDRHSDEAKSRRQMNAFFDVDAAANSHDGRSLKAERSGKKLSKTELKQFKEKRKARKEEKRRAWLRD
ncbi:WW domain-containing protein [Verticillium dahliae VdLs.17]|uniref:WW domain-containing protein n=1 Tax=Verticillium dahliae (strain VdLs.17 / ATCC MYA-4575 / FGSC 10137) TaxID=498257 RepID=G2XHP4_VERDV|nr:WW domain-containing protein [Verticillium dahliae VdLs.17]EGY19338.1 WW domain-containing protein [Verticillium dahliae VdLs.17]